MDDKYKLMKVGTAAANFWSFYKLAMAVNQPLLNSY